jgi:ABC-type glycerol-3-phosphate transport system substrate-binding protein
MAEAIKAAGVTDTPVVLLLDSWLVETQLTGSRHTLVDNDNGYGSGETTAATFDDAQTTSVFDWIQSMEAAGLLLPVPVTDGARGHYLAMATQKASITLETSTVATTVQDVIAGGTPVVTGDGGSIDTSGLDIGASPVVGVDAPGKAQIGGNAFWITTAGTDAQKAGAWDLLKWWNQEPQQVQWHIEGSYLPFLQSAAADPEVQRFWDSTLAGGFLHTAYDEFTQSVDPDFTGALIGPYDKFRQSMRDALASVAFEGTDPAAAIATAERETNQALTDYNDSNF